MSIPEPPKEIPVSQKLFDLALVFLAIIMLGLASASALPYGIQFSDKTSTSLLMAGSFLLGIATMKLGALA